MRILILSSSTGGGHDMRARSLTSWCERQSPPIEIARYQALEESSSLYGFGVGVYNWIQRKWPRLHHIYFNFLEVFQVSASKHLLLGKEKFRQRLKEVQPDLIVSVHAHTNHAFRAIAKEVLPDVRFITYCGEMHGGYGFSKHWVDRGADAFIGATPEICDAAKAAGMAQTKAIYGGFLLNPKFYGPKLSATARAQLFRGHELDPERFTLLLSTGANGALNHLGFIRAIEKAALEIQIIALCGRNLAAKAEIESIANTLESITVRALGYREDMFELMQCVSGIVARPGTGTTSEAILAGCPIYLNAVGGVMPQEWITVKFLRNRGLQAPLIRRPDDLVSALRPRIEDARSQATAIKQMQSLEPAKHPQEIIDRLRHFASTERPDPLA